MPRGKKKEELAEIGKNTRFTAENAAENAKKGHAARAQKANVQQAVTQWIANGGLELILQAVEQGVKSGNHKMVELAAKLAGQMPKDQLDVTVNEPRRFVFEICKNKK